MGFFDSTSLVLDFRRVDVGEDTSTATRVYRVNNQDDPESVIAWIAGQGVEIGDAHPSLSGYFLDSYSAEPSDGSVLVTFVWTTPDEVDSLEDANGEIWKWSFGVQQQHITSVDSPSDQKHYPSTKNVGQVIGLNGDTVEGTDVYRPFDVLTISKRISNANFTSEYQKVVRDARGRVNSGVFAGYSSYDVLFMGANVEPVSSTHKQVTFTFYLGIDQGTQRLQLSSGATVNVDAEPWDYVWGQTVNKFDTDTRYRSRNIDSVHVATVYRSMAFFTLQIGTDLT